LRQIEGAPVTSQSTIDLLRHLAGKPGHDEVKADFRDLLIGEFGAELSALDFERRCWSFVIVGG
jgi:hypothetical protein